MTKELCRECSGECILLEAIDVWQGFPEAFGHEPQPESELEASFAEDRQEAKRDGCPYWDTPISQVRRVMGSEGI